MDFAYAEFEQDLNLARRVNARRDWKILKHCGMWKETVQRPPPQKELIMIKEPSLDYEFFDRVCIWEFPVYLQSFQAAQCLLTTPSDNYILLCQFLLNFVDLYLLNDYIFL